MEPFDDDCQSDERDPRYLALRELPERSGISEDDANYLHRRISSKVDELQLDNLLQKAYLTDVDSDQELLQTCKRLTSCAREIVDHFGFLRQLSPLDPVLAQS